jgi:beta-phosphoglucomutase
MDGVIVDSMPYHYLAWYEVLRPLGVRVTCFDIYAVEGERWDRTIKKYFTRAGIKVSRQRSHALFKERQRLFDQYFKRHLFKGIEATIDRLKEYGFPLALVTGTPLKEVKKILPPHLFEQFEVVVAGDQVKRGKPFPDPYRKAARLLQIKPADCLVIENAPYGIRSARSAGMKCVAVTTSLPKEYLTGADSIVDTVTEILKCIVPPPAQRIKKSERMTKIKETVNA